MVTTRSSGRSSVAASGLEEKKSSAKKRASEVLSELETASPKRARIRDRTDKTRWRMRDDESRQTWHYIEDDEAAKDWSQTTADKYYLGMPLDLPDLEAVKTPLDAARNGADFLEKLQLPSGHWGCEYGGPMFLLPGVVITWYITKTPIPWYKATEIKNYLFARANPVDGGWGLHIEGESSVMGTLLNYTTLRLIGVEADHPKMAQARATLHKLGGATHGPHWTKFWLSALGVMNWDICNPVPPEIWLLPDWVPFHPSKWWIHIRMPFLAMSYIKSRRWQMEEDDLIRALRKEVFVEPWETINWAAHRNSISAIDNYNPKTWVLNTLNWLLVNVWDPYLRPASLGNWAESWVSELIDMEDENTDYSGLACVNGPMNYLMCYIRDGPDAYSVRRHRERTEEILWVNNEGMLCSGTNGVQCWDTAFTIQAIMAAGLTSDPRFRPMLLKSLHFLDNQQIRENVKHQEKCYRHPRKGAWSFSNKDQGYAVSDCISEALKSVIILQKSPGYPQLLDDQRIFDAIDTLLTYQNASGACSSYERQRQGEWLEVLNAAEVFGRIMVEYEYPECTTAVVTALSLFHKHWPDYRKDEIEKFIDRAVKWIKTAQIQDGSWYGSWGICFTYAAMFALESLASIGETYGNSVHSRKGCDFLISKQREDGGWSESYKACELSEYIEHPSGSQVVMTSWALIGLMEAEYPDVERLKRGIKLLMERQQPNGEWKQEAIEGVFNKTAMISFPNYKLYFPVKALGMFGRLYPEEKFL